MSELSPAKRNELFGSGGRMCLHTQARPIPWQNIPLAFCSLVRKEGAKGASQAALFRKLRWRVANRLRDFISDFQGELK
jgi:hypothetical protein